MVVGMFLSCSEGREHAEMLDCIDTLMNNHPDSALQMLDSLRSEKPHWSKSQRMRYDLLHLKAENKSFVPLTSDSVAKNLVSYYDTWGNPNERMMAHYLLGCVYRDMGEAPQATEAYLDAIAQADTTSKDCDYFTLSRIYAQMAEIYHKQLLFSYEINACKQSCRYAFLAKDTITAIFEKDTYAGIYIIINKRDSAEILLKEVQSLYKEYGFTQNALQSSTKLMHLYVQDERKHSVIKELMDEYEAESNSFDRNHELSGTRRQYYYYKGKYFEGIQNLDSAEYYYRKVYHPKMSIVAKNPMYKGLLSVFTKRHQTDSIAKYAQLYCETNDSSIAIKDQELTVQMAATYNYSLYQKEALENESKAHRALLLLITITVFICIIGIIIFTQLRKYKRNKKKEIAELKEKYSTAVDEYTNNLHTLQLLDNAHKETIAIIQQELDRAKGENETYRKKVSEINNEYENNRHELIKDNNILRIKIENLKRQEGISRQLSVSSNFAETDIMKRVSYLIEHPLESMSEDELELLVKTASSYYPTLLHDLINSPNISKKEIRACILISQAIRESDIAHILNTSAQRITNIKATLNRELFHQNSARSLCKNLVKRYEIYVL